MTEMLFVYKNGEAVAIQPKQFCFELAMEGYIADSPNILTNNQLDLTEPEVKVVKENGTDCDEMEQLEKANMRFIVSVANQYQKQGLTLEELIEAGTKGLRKGAMKYNLEADFSFIAYAVWWIHQSIMQAIEEKK